VLIEATADRIVFFGEQLDGPPASPGVHVEPVQRHTVDDRRAGTGWSTTRLCWSASAANRVQIEEPRSRCNVTAASAAVSASVRRIDFCKMLLQSQGSGGRLAA